MADIVPLSTDARMGPATRSYSDGGDHRPVVSPTAVRHTRRQAMESVSGSRPAARDVMTINVLRGRRAAVPDPAPAAPVALPIGDDDSDIFSCPSCARPLATGARRCPGCGTRLLMGVQAARASVFVALGLAVGLMIGAVVGVVAVTPTPADPAQTGASAVPAVPGASGLAAASAPAIPPAATSAPANPAVPPAARTALTQTATMNARLVTGLPTLEAALAAPTLDTGAVAGVLRSMTADAAFAKDVAAKLRGWPAAASVGAALGTFYEDIRATALDGLAASLGNEAAYRAAAQRMVGILYGLAPLDAASRDIAREAGLTLPAVNLPEAPAPVPPTAD